MKNTTLFKQEIFSFKNQASDIWLAKYIDKIFLIIVTILTSFTIFTYGVNLISLFVFSIPYGLIFLYILFQKRFAYEITIDFSLKKIIFKMHRNNEHLIINFNDILSIYVNGYVIIKSDKTSVFYNDLQDERIFYCLNKIKKIQFGPLSFLSGPNAKVRKNLCR